MTSHYNDPNPSYGNSRKGGDASQSVKDSVIGEIIRQGRNAGLQIDFITSIAGAANDAVFEARMAG